jgi:hypothetical protein
MVFFAELSLELDMVERFYIFVLNKNESFYVGLL